MTAGRPPGRGGRARACGYVAKLVAAGVGAALLAACSQTGDFGRPKHHPADPSFYQKIEDGFGELFSSSYERPMLMTDDERELRARAWRFVEGDTSGSFPADVVERIRAVFSDAEENEPRPEHYYRDIARPQTRSGASFWSRLIVDMKSDLETLEPFAQTAFRVADIDRERMRKARGAGQLGEAALEQVSARIGENRDLVFAVHYAVLDRLAAYSYALERGGVELPDLREAEARNAYVALKEGVGPVGEVVTVYDRQRGWADAGEPGASDGGIKVVSPPPIVDLSVR